MCSSDSLGECFRELALLENTHDDTHVVTTLATAAGVFGEAKVAGGLADFDGRHALNEPGPDEFDSLLVCEDVPDTIACKDEEFVVGREFHGPNLGVGGDHLLLWRKLQEVHEKPLSNPTAQEALQESLWNAQGIHADTLRIP